MINLNWRNLKEFGLKYCSIMAPSLNSIGLFSKKVYKPDGSCNHVFVSSTSPYYIGVFRLSKEEAESFDKGDLSLIPPGYCGASWIRNKPVLENAVVIHKGTLPRSKKHLAEIIKKCEEL